MFQKNKVYTMVSSSSLMCVSTYFYGKKTEESSRTSQTKKE